MAYGATWEVSNTYPRWISSAVHGARWPRKKLWSQHWLQFPRISIQRPSLNSPTPRLSSWNEDIGFNLDSFQFQIYHNNRGTDLFRVSVLPLGAFWLVCLILPSWPSEPERGLRSSEHLHLSAMESQLCACLLYAIYLILPVAPQIKLKPGQWC